MTRGKFIILEGIDGSGTTTQAEKLGVYLAHEFAPTIVEREPWPGGLEASIRDHIERGTPPDEMAVLFTADRIRHCIEVIEPALAEGIFVVCDRYRVSTLVYQSHDRPDHQTRFVRKLARLPSLIEPDLTILLDVDPQIAHARMRRSLDRYERDRVFQAEIREQYLREAKITPNCAVVSANPDTEDVARAIRSELWRLR